MATGLFAEEFLFRGAVNQLADRGSGGKLLWRIPVAIYISSLCFSLHHLQFHHFEINPASITQVTYTFVMGMFFGMLRAKSGSIWPPVVVHMVNNSMALHRNL